MSLSSRGPSRAAMQLLRVVLVLSVAVSGFIASPTSSLADHQEPTTPDDPLLAGCESIALFGGCFLWGLKQVRAEEAWHRSTGAGVVVAVLDTGIDFSHEDLVGQVIPGKTFDSCGASGCPGGDGSWPGTLKTTHGTHVAGTIVANRNNGVGLVGVAPSARALAVRVFNSPPDSSSSEPGANFADIGYGIRYATDQGAKVINMSLGNLQGVAFTTTGLITNVTSAINYASSKGVLVVASAGNYPQPVCGTPAWEAGALCVVATDRRENRAAYSSGPVKPDLNAVSAPGGSLLPICREGVISTVPANTASAADTQTCGYPPNRAYDEYNGTSMAAPHVTGVAALLYAQGCTRTQTLDIIKNTSRTPRTDVRGTFTPAYGWGVVDAAAATASAAATCSGGGTTNNAPVANTDSLTTDEDILGSVNVLTNDVDADGDPLTVAAVGQGSNGSVINAGGGIVSYTPKPDFFGTDSFSYTVSDGKTTSQGSVNVIVTPVEDPPQAFDDFVFYPASGPITFDPRVNDRDPDGDPITITSNSRASFGDVVGSPTSLTYMPRGGYAGADAINYTIESSGGSSSGRIVLFGFECVVQYSDNFEGVPNVDSDNPFTRGWGQDVDSEYTQNPTVGWRPLPDAQAKSASQSFTDTADNVGYKDSRVISPALGISPTSKLRFWHRYVLENTFDGGVLEVSIDGGVTWEDILEAGGQFTKGGYDRAISTSFASAIGGREAWTGSNEGGYPAPPLRMTEVEVDLSALAGQTIALRWRLVTDDFFLFPSTAWSFDDVSVNDTVKPACLDVANGLVPPTNTPPVAIDDQLFANQDASGSVAPLANDSDADGDAISVTSFTPAVNGSVLRNGNVLFYTPDPGFFGTDQFTYSIADGYGGTATATVQVDVNGKPTAADDSGSAIAPDDATVAVLANDTDPESHMLVVASFTQGDNGTVSCLVDSCTYTPNPDFGGTDSFDYEVCDARGACDIATVTIQVQADVTPPPAPVILTPSEGDLVGRMQLFSGNTEPLSSVLLYENGVRIGVVHSDEFGQWGALWNFLGSGMHTVTATAIDRAQNEGEPTSPLTFEVDVDGPQMTVDMDEMEVFTPINPVEISGSATDNRGVTRVRLRYYNSDGDLVRDVDAFCPDCHATTGKSVEWSDNPPWALSGPLLPGGYFVVIDAHDQAGNIERQTYNFLKLTL